MDVAIKEELDPVLLEILVCPITKTPLVYDRKAEELVSQAAGLAYPVRKGIPVMLPEEARKLSA
ncbi:Trm112 family protein [Rhodomicrobium sp. Az07]|uniref:Trm112 family protein n=1 Tax=Rhodomicrobium sp. Az07 TaxID=2839034 RepID=UPI001BED364C|nr:Trm112 family protein [Rhodomicrobium sp. Az07]MBT3071365.1 Trm112 family protein [Rhodomicrobium sp. Az07]